jgi:hypothetical protein
MQTSASETFERNFWTLVEDGIKLLRAAEQASGTALAAPLARASLFTCLVLPEVVANCCIDHLALSQRVASEVDRMSVLAKYEFYLYTRFKGRALPRGILPVQGLSELKRLRDDYVHPKKSRVVWDGPEDGVQSAQRPTTPILGIATHPQHWWIDDAVIGMRAVHSFFRFYFVDCCRYRRTAVASLLSAELEVPVTGDYFVPFIHPEDKASLAGWGVDLGYIKHA